MFIKYTVNYSDNIFNQLSECSSFEYLAKGRQGAVLVDSKEGLVPIVRTTTSYQNPAQQFLPIHYDILDNIKRATYSETSIRDLHFNNALVEIYDSQYCSMKFHSDQSLDLADNSFICVFSCYDNPNTPDVRKLKIRNKIIQEYSGIPDSLGIKDSEISLDHNTFVLFSLETNYKHLHKIVLEKNTSNSKWLGITFRLSKTYIRFENQIPIMHPSSQILRIASQDQFQQFIKKRGEENRSLQFIYPFFDYTLSPSDRLPPISNS